MKVFIIFSLFLNFFTLSANCLDSVKLVHSKLIEKDIPVLYRSIEYIPNITDQIIIKDKFAKSFANTFIEAKNQKTLAKKISTLFIEGIKIIKKKISAKDILYRTIFLEGENEKEISASISKFFIDGLKLKDSGTHLISHTISPETYISLGSACYIRSIFFGQNLKTLARYMNRHLNNKKLGNQIIIIFKAKEFKEDGAGEIFSKGQYRSVSKDIPGKYIQAIYLYDANGKQLKRIENSISNIFQ